MNRFRQGTLPATLAVLLLLSTGVVLVGPLLPGPFIRDSALEQWLRGRLGPINEASVEHAIEAALSGHVRSHEEGLRVFAETLIRVDGRTASRLAGVETDSPEVLLQALEYRLERAIGDAMAPEHRLSNTVLDRVATSERSAGILSVSVAEQRILLQAVSIRLLSDGLRIVPLRILSSARPLGP